MPERLPPNTLRRSDVREAIRLGVGAFLQAVELDVERPVFRDNKFFGFRILALDPSFFRGVDLRPGDVIARVNGFGLERPDDAQQALESLAVASALEVEIERDGRPRQLHYAIVDDGAVAPAPAASARH